MSWVTSVFAQPPGDSAEFEHETSKDDLERAFKLHDEARELYGEGRYRDAANRLEEAVRLDPKAAREARGKDLFYNLGTIYEKLGDLPVALDHFRKSRDLETDPAERAKMDRLIRRVEGAIQHGQLEKPQRDNVRDKVAPAPPPKVATETRFSPFTWVAVGVASVALATATTLAVHATTSAPDRDSVTSEQITIADLQSDADSSHRVALVADVTFVVSALAGATALVLALTTSETVTTQEAAGLKLELRPAGGALRWSF